MMSRRTILSFRSGSSIAQGTKSALSSQRELMANLLLLDKYKEPITTIPSNLP